METLDWIVVCGYFAGLGLLAWWVTLKSRETTQDYFLASHSLGWFIVGASIFASNIGSEHLVGLAGSGATDGVALAHYELHAWCLLVLAWILVPFYTRSKVFTMPQFLERRFSSSSRYLLSIISLIAYVVTKIAVGIYAGGVVFAVLLPNLRLGPLDSFWLGSIIVLVFTGVYTTLGGFRAVAYTEAIQTIILVIGSALVTYYGVEKVGGWAEMKETVGNEMFNLWKPLVAEGTQFTWSPVEERNAAGELTAQAWYFNGNYPWLGMLICAPIIGLWYWCTDQYIVQRALGATSESEARRGCIFSSYLKLLPVLIFIIPGIASYALILKTQAGQETGMNFTGMLDAEGEKIVESGMAFPIMVRDVLPAGVRGVVVAGLLAALMSSLAGVFNACSTLFTIDLYTKYRPNASEQQLVRVGRIATIVMVLIGMAWIPVIQGSKGLYDYLQSVQGYLAPPIFVVFFFGIFWKRLNAAGCYWAMVIGFLMGLFRLAVDTLPKYHGDPNYFAEGSFFWIVNKIYFQYFSILIFLVSAAVMVVVSYLTAEPDYAKFRGLTYGTVSEEEARKTREGWNMGDVVASVFVCVLIVGAYLYFTG